MSSVAASDVSDPGTGDQRRLKRSQGFVEEVFEIIHSITHLYRPRQFCTAGQNEDELTYMESKVLGFFAHRPNTTLSDLVAHSGRDKAQLTRLIKSLRERGLLEAQPDVLDRRCTRLRPSAAGKAVHAQFQRHGALATEQALAGLEEGERRQLVALLARVRANLNAVPRAP